MDMYPSIIGRTIILYFLIIIIFRIMGKREIAELSIFDLVVFLMTAEIAVTSIENHKDPLLHTIIPMLVLLSIQITLAYLSLKSTKLRHILDGKPTVIINRGKVDEHAMRSQRYNIDDLLTQLREKDISSIADVEFAILESSGKLSIIKKDENEKESPMLQMPLIVDGFIQEDHLKLIDKNDNWLKEELEKLGYHDIKKISICTYNNGTFSIDLMDEIK
ncbi:DUF421 domain-containing protein [Metabacillus malikii]|nr:DUF421 domain-containing protein [Metabacillus malikii]